MICGDDITRERKNIKWKITLYIIKCPENIQVNKTKKHQFVFKSNTNYNKTKKQRNIVINWRNIQRKNNLQNEWQWNETKRKCEEMTGNSKYCSVTSILCCSLDSLIMNNETHWIKSLEIMLILFVKKLLKDLFDVNKLCLEKERLHKTLLQVFWITCVYFMCIYEQITVDFLVYCLHKMSTNIKGWM